MNLNSILTDAVNKGASDIHIKVGTPPKYRISGEIAESEFAVIEKNDIYLFMDNLSLEDYLKEKFDKNRQIDVGYGIRGVGRFRVNLFFQRGTPAMVFRFIPFTIPSIDELGLPEIVKEIAAKQRGLILVTGVTGSGKSTTLASMINYINQNFRKNIITIEDPIEYIFRDEKSVVVQRQIGFDCNDFTSGLKGALREDPDVIMVGEMRDLETIKTAIEAAETGHLVLSTLHTLNAPETVNRIISTFDIKDQMQIRSQLASSLEAIISQRLIKSADSKKRVVATEILVGTPFVKESIKVPEKNTDLQKALNMGNDGMISFDNSLLLLYKKGLISRESALEYANSKNDLALKMTGIG